MKSKNGQHWTKEDKDFVKDNYQILSDKEMGIHFDRSPVAVREMRIRLGLYRRCKYNSYSGIQPTIERPPAIYGNLDVNANLDYWATYHLRN